MLAGSTALGQALVLAVSPVLTRLYRPEDFGILAVYASILSILVVPSSLRYECAIPLPKRDGDALLLLGVSLSSVGVLAVLVALVSIPAGPALARWTSSPGLVSYLWLLPLSLIAAGFYQALSYWVIRDKNYRIVARTRLTQSGAQVAAQLGLGFLGAGAAGLLVSDVLGRSAGTGTLATLALKEVRRVPRRFDAARIKAVIVRYARFPAFAAPAGLLNAAGLYLPPLLLASLYGPQCAGWFALSQRALGAPMKLVGNAMGQVYLGEASRLSREDPRGLERLFTRIAGRTLKYGVPFVGAVGLVAPWLFPWVFGEVWRESGKYVLAMTPLFMVQFVVSPLSQTAFVLERQRLQLGWDALRVAIVLVVFLGGRAAGLTAAKAILAYSTAMSLAFLLLFFLYFTAVKRHAASHEHAR